MLIHLFIKQTSKITRILEQELKYQRTIAKYFKQRILTRTPEKNYQKWSDYMSLQEDMEK